MNKRHRLPKIGGGAEGDIRITKITGIFAKTFYQATKLMSEKQRKAVWAIYVWCRRTDDLVDGPRAMMNTDLMKVRKRFR